MRYIGHLEREKEKETNTEEREKKKKHRMGVSDRATLPARNCLYSHEYI